MARQREKQVSVSESAALLVYPEHFGCSKVVLPLPGITLTSGRAAAAAGGGQRDRAWPGETCGRGGRELPVTLSWSESEQHPQSHRRESRLQKPWDLQRCPELYFPHFLQQKSHLGGPRPALWVLSAAAISRSLVQPRGRNRAARAELINPSGIPGAARLPLAWQEGLMPCSLWAGQPLPAPW